MLARAKAKLNLFLHVTGIRSDGYHLLESLAAFAELADDLTFENTREDFCVNFDNTAIDNVHIHPTENTIYKAATLLAQNNNIKPTGRLSVKKRIPVGAGLGGGSSDAAATLHLLKEAWLLPKNTELFHIGLSIGADVPVCLSGVPTFFSGIGEKLDVIRELPANIHAVIAWPRNALLTKEVFAIFDKENHDFSNKDSIRKKINEGDPRNILSTIMQAKNDLTTAAARLEPKILDIISALSNSKGCYMARMTGAGSASFGLFTREDDAIASTKAIIAMGYHAVTTIINQGDDNTQIW